MIKSGEPESLKPVIKIDGSIPLWGITLLFIAGATYCWGELKSIDGRVTIQETNSTIYRDKVDKLEAQQKDSSKIIGQMSADLQLVKELLIRLEKRLDPR